MNAPDILSLGAYRNCSLCPKICKTDRGLITDFHDCGDVLTATRAALHHWKESCIDGASASGGSGTVFSFGCTLGYRLCQNHQISNGRFGRGMTAKELDQTFFRLQDQGAYNIDLVMPTQYLSHIVSALGQVRSKLIMPVAYNCGDYKRVETVKALRDYADIWLPNLKCCGNRPVWRYSRAKDYSETTAATIRQVIDQTGVLVYQSTSLGLLVKGIIIRHVILPEQRHDSIILLERTSGSLPRGRYMISLMSQYAPYIGNREFPELNRRIISCEYGKVADIVIRLEPVQGFIQEKSSAREEYIPPFDLGGL